MIVTTRPCPTCGSTSTVEVDPAAYDRWRSGTLIQNAFPTWSPAERELLITGYHPKCWDRLFDYEEENG